MVFVYGLAEVAALLLIPPIAVGVAELALDERRVNVAAVLQDGALAIVIRIVLSHILLQMLPQAPLPLQDHH